jgi:hypothetical protein
MSITDLLQERLDALNIGSVIMTVDRTDNPINVAIKDSEGTWALGGHPAPWPGEQLARSIEVAGVELIVLVAE